MAGRPPKPSLPHGWIVRQSTTYPDKIYYFNTNTGDSAWELSSILPVNEPQVAPQYYQQPNPTSTKRPHSSARPEPEKRPHSKDGSTVGRGQLHLDTDWSSVSNSRSAPCPDRVEVSSSRPVLGGPDLAGKMGGESWARVSSSNEALVGSGVGKNWINPSDAPSNKHWSAVEARFSPEPPEGGSRSPSPDLTSDFRPKRVSFGETSCMTINPIEQQDHYEQHEQQHHQNFKPISVSPREQRQHQQKPAIVAVPEPIRLPVCPNKSQIGNIIWTTRNQSQGSKLGSRSRLGYYGNNTVRKRSYNKETGPPSEKSALSNQSSLGFESGHIDQNIDCCDDSLFEGVEDVEIGSLFGVPVSMGNKRKVVNSGLVTKKRLKIDSVALENLPDNSNSNSSSGSNTSSGKGMSFANIFVSNQRKVIASNDIVPSERTVVSKSADFSWEPAPTVPAHVPVQLVHKTSGVKRKSSDFSAGINKDLSISRSKCLLTPPKIQKMTTAARDSIHSAVSPNHPSENSQHSVSSSHRKVVRIKRFRKPSVASTEMGHDANRSERQNEPNKSASVNYITACMPADSSGKCSLLPASPPYTVTPLPSMVNVGTGRNVLVPEPKGNIKDPTKLISIQNWVDKLPVDTPSSSSPDTTHSGMSGASLTSLTSNSDIHKFKVPPPETRLTVAGSLACREHGHVADLSGPTTKDLSDSGYSPSNFSSALHTPTTTSTPRPREDARDVVQMDVDEQVQIREDLEVVRESIKANPDQLFGKLTESVSHVSTGVSSMEVDVSVATGLRKENQGLFVVLDTNVLMDHLAFIEEFMDTSIQGLGRPTLVIPWVVLQELDVLKDKKETLSTQAKARRPARFLHKCLETNHPRLVGQTPQESKVKIGQLDIECNDDRVLHCCLQWKQKYPRSKMLLFTNDINLCNKARVAHILPATKENLQSKLQSLAEDGHDSDALVTQKSCIPQPSIPQSTEENVRQVEVTPDKSATRRETDLQLADGIVCEMKTSMKPILSEVLETEMKEQYESDTYSWTDIVIRKPPWESLRDVLECFKKHWMAVFGDLLQRRNQDHFHKLLLHFQHNSGYGTNIRQACCLLDSCVVILDDLLLAKKKRYQASTKEPLRIVKALQSLCQDINQGRKRTSDIPDLHVYLGLKPVSLPVSSQQTVVEREITQPLSPTESLADLEEMSAGVSNTTIEQEHDDYIFVHNKFQKNWLKIRQLEQETILNVTRGLGTQVVESISRHLPILAILQAQFHRALEIKRREIRAHGQHFSALSATMNHDFFTAHDADMNASHVSAEQLQKFFSKKSNISILRNGYQQLNNMLLEMARCVEIVEEQNQAGQ